MDGSAPEQEIIQFPDQAAEQLHDGVRKPLNQMGHSGPEDPPAETKFPLTDELTQIGVDASHIVGTGFHELIKGQDRSTRNRVTHNKNPISIAVERAKRRLNLGKAA